MSTLNALKNKNLIDKKSQSFAHHETTNRKWAQSLKTSQTILINKKTCP